MFSQPPIITETGITLLLRAAAGEKITFRKFQAGSGMLGQGETPKQATALKQVVLSNIPITQAIQTGESGYIQLTGSFNNQTDVQQDFRWTELGLIGEDEDGNEYLYAYGYDDEYAELINASESAVMLEQYINCIIAIGESENITAYVIPNATYASREEFLAHVNDHNNPHEVTLEQLDAAAANHSHAASEITSGLLPLSRGGTGVGTLADLKTLIGSGDMVFGIFSGDGTTRKDITLGFKPDRVWLILCLSGNIGTSQTEAWSFSPDHNVYHNGCPASSFTDTPDVLFARGHGGAAVTDTGFAVGYYNTSSGTNTGRLNMKNRTYMFIAGKIPVYAEADS